MEPQKTQYCQSPEENVQAGGLILSDSRQYCRATVIKISWYWHMQRELLPSPFKQLCPLCCAGTAPGHTLSLTKSVPLCGQRSQWPHPQGRKRLHCAEGR